MTSDRKDKTRFFVRSLVRMAYSLYFLRLEILTYLPLPPISAPVADSIAPTGKKRETK